MGEPDGEVVGNEVDGGAVIGAKVGVDDTGDMMGD